MVDGLLWHNPGGVGVPASDGTPRAWLSLLVPGLGAIEIRHRSLKYDHRAEAAAMRAGRLPQGYPDALSSGLSHSLDVLPLEDLARTGQALAPETLHLPTAA